MNRFIRISSLSCAIALAATTAQAATSGYVELGQFKPTDGCQFVEVNLHAPLLKLAALFVDKDEPDAAALIRSLEHVRVNVVGYNEGTQAETTDRVKAIRRDLDAQGWQRMVTVQEGGKAQDVAIYLKMGENETIAGLVVTVMDSGEHQAVVVNVVGNIKPEQIAAIGKSLHIDPLSKLAINGGPKGH